MEVNHKRGSTVTPVIKKEHKQNEFIVKIPIDVNFDKCYNPYILNKKKGRDHIAYILGVLVYKSEQKRLDYNSFHSLESKTLQSLFRNETKRYLQSLIDNEYIKLYSNPYTYIKNGVKYKCNGTYKPGQTSKRYALNITNPLLVEYVITDKKLIDKIKRARIERTQKTIKNSPTAAKIYDSIKLLSINDTAAIEFLNKTYNKNTIDSYFAHLHNEIGIDKTNLFIQELQRTKNDKEVKTLFKKYGYSSKHSSDVKKIFKDYNSLQYRLHQVEIIKRIQNGEHDLITIVQDNKTGRLFHTLTMTPKNIKSFLLLDKEPLIELDASNCQWWLLQKVLNILISKDFLIKDKNINNQKNVDTFNIHSYIYNTNNTPMGQPYLYMFNTFLNNNKEVIQKEVYKLEALLYNGTFRTTFIKEFSKQGKNVTDGDVKMWLLKHLLFSNPAEPYHKGLIIVKEFRSLFPNLYKIINNLKLYILNDKELQPKKDKKHPNKPVRWKSLAILLQKMEADVFINDMATTDGVFITLHDALITNDSNLHKIQNSLSKAIEKRDLKMTLNISK